MGAVVHKLCTQDLLEVVRGNYQQHNDNATTGQRLTQCRLLLNFFEVMDGQHKANFYQGHRQRVLPYNFVITMPKTRGLMFHEVYIRRMRAGSLLYSLLDQFILP